MRLAVAVLLTALPAFWPGPAAAGEADTLLQAAQAVEARRADAWLASTEAQLQLTQAQRPASPPTPRRSAPRPGSRRNTAPPACSSTAPCCHPHPTPWRAP